MSRRETDADAQIAPQAMRCSFCSKDQGAVSKLIAGPNAFICDECVEACNQIIADDDPGATFDASLQQDAPADSPLMTCKLCGMTFPLAEGLVVKNRGFLCPGCIQAIDNALEDR